MFESLGEAGFGKEKKEKKCWNGSLPT